MNLQESILKNLDIDYSYQLAKRMEQFRTNPVLGYRPAGSRAEFETGEMLKQEMEAIGLSDVRKDAIKVDGWEFKKQCSPTLRQMAAIVKSSLVLTRPRLSPTGQRTFP